MKKCLAAAVLVILSILFLIGCSRENKNVNDETKQKINLKSINIGNEHSGEKNSLNSETATTSNKNSSGKVYYSKKAVVLTYHHISREPFSAITIKPERFEADLKMLQTKGFNVISIRELVEAMGGKGQLPDNAVVISFDDGIESFYKYAYPYLKKYNMKAVNFIITSNTENYHPSPKDFNPLSKEEVKEIYESKLVDIQSHTHGSHVYVTRNSSLKEGGKLAFRIYDRRTKSFESEDAYLKRIREDLDTSRKIIYKYTGVYPDMLCFPFGHYNRKIIDVSKELGFKYFVTTQAGVNRENSKSIKILRIRSGDARLNSDKLFRSIINIANNSQKKAR